MRRALESWYRATTRSAAQIRKRFGVPDQAAAEMWTAGRKRASRHQRALWQRIYREVFPDFHRMDKLTRSTSHTRCGGM